MVGLYIFLFQIENTSNNEITYIFFININPRIYASNLKYIAHLAKLYFIQKHINFIFI